MHSLYLIDFKTKLIFIKFFSKDPILGGGNGVNPNQAEGGGKLLQGNQNDYFSGTECLIYLTPGCKFKCVCCLEMYLKKYSNIGTFSRRVYLGVYFGVHEGP